MIWGGGERARGRGRAQGGCAQVKGASRQLRSSRGGRGLSLRKSLSLWVADLETDDDTYSGKVLGKRSNYFSARAAGGTGTVLQSLCCQRRGAAAAAAALG